MFMLDLSFFIKWYFIFRDSFNPIDFHTNLLKLKNKSDILFIYTWIGIVDFIK